MRCSRASDGSIRKEGRIAAPLCPGMLVRQARPAVRIAILARETSRGEFVRITRIEQPVLRHEIAIGLRDAARIDAGNSLRRIVQS